MPVLLASKLDRRSFLRYSAWGAAVVVAAGCRTAGTGSAGRREFHVALMSDTHVPGDRMNGSRGFNPWENLKRIVPDVAASGAEAVVHCGDVARLEGKPEDYAEVRGLLAPLVAKMPVYLALGNHDDREAFWQAFPPGAGGVAAVKGRQVLVIEHDVVRFVVLDSLMYPNKTPGFLGQAQRDWLAKYLADHRDRPVVVCVHHTLGAADGELLDADRLLSILAPQRHVKAVIYGHSHVWERKERDGLQLINLPAVGYNFGDAQPVGWVDARFHGTGVDLVLHTIGGNQAENGRAFAVAWR